MRDRVIRFKNMAVALKELEPFIRKPEHLQTGKPFQRMGGLRSREILANWLMCVVMNAEHGNEDYTFSSDPTGGDGVITELSSGYGWLTEHVMVPKKRGDDADLEELILDAVKAKHAKGEPYAGGKMLIVFVNFGEGQWIPNRVAARLPEPLLFSEVTIVGLHAIDAESYSYGLTSLHPIESNAPIWIVKVKSDFSSWTVERIPVARRLRLPATDLDDYLAEVEGYAFMFLWPNAGDWNHFAPFVLAGAAQAAHLAFLVIILDVRRLLPRLFVAMQAYVAVGLALLGWFAVGGPIVPLMIFSVVGYVPMLVVLMLRAMRLQIDGAGFLLMGQLSVLVFFNLLFSAGVEGVVIPPGMYFFHYAKIGFLLEAIFYLFALGNRSRLVRLRHENNLRLRLLESEELARAEAERFKALQAARQHQLHIAASGHDLAQPVHSMRMALSAIKDDEQSATSRHIAKALDLTEDLLRDMVEGAKHGPRLYPLALGDLLQEVHERHLDRARRKGLELRIVVPDLTLNASPIVLTRLLDNLVGNAIRYTDRGRVLIGARRRPGGVEIQVADTGPGFATAERDRLLAPFQQSGALREESAGHGLGLYIVERLCRQSGYDLRIASRRGRGSVFGIFVPEGE